MNTGFTFIGRNLFVLYCVSRNFALHLIPKKDTAHQNLTPIMS